MKSRLEINGKPRQIHNIRFVEFRKRPVVIKARQINYPFKVHTLEGVMTGKAGDWLIIGIKGEPYSCDHEIFMETYEEVK